MNTFDEKRHSFNRHKSKILNEIIDDFKAKLKDNGFDINRDDFMFILNVTSTRDGFIGYYKREEGIHNLDITPSDDLNAEIDTKGGKIND